MWLPFFIWFLDCCPTEILVSRSVDCLIGTYMILLSKLKVTTISCNNEILLEDDKTKDIDQVAPASQLLPHDISRVHRG